MKAPLNLEDIAWLRRADTTAGALEVPSPVASRLLGGRFVERDTKRDCLRTTALGKLALTRLA